MRRNIPELAGWLALRGVPDISFHLFLHSMATEIVLAVLVGVVLVPMSVVLVLLGVTILKGKGDMLISGYNTLPAEKKAQYDVKRLRRVTAVLLFVIAIMLSLYELCISTLDESQLAVAAIVLTVVIIATCIIGVILMNTYCKRK